MVCRKIWRIRDNRFAIEAIHDISPSSVLDIGCGSGAALRHAYLQWPNALLVGVDPVPRMVEIAQERLIDHPGMNSIKFHVGTAEKLLVESASFDLVLAFDSVDHWNDVNAGAVEVARVLVQGGHVVIVKDQGVPGDRDRVVELFTRAGGLALERSQLIQKEDVSFTMWVFEKQESRSDAAA